MLQAQNFKYMSRSKAFSCMFHIFFIGFSVSSAPSLAPGNIKDLFPCLVSGEAKHMKAEAVQAQSTY